MLKRLRMWSYLAAATGATLFQLGGCFGGNFFYNTDAGSWSRIITAILREDIFS
ncbi:MAG TPA: hypothetical protein PLQ89_01545 [Phycisphaerae bacterium]|nr:hypothetical protein [Phycisphaerae bacterium]HOJ72775.1 hypothetical protein [Phycisphaerae bacterium]HOM51798.1 hypothetical protein [Phycisphaerae bacterium]HON69336.1 hypothetical protein [Phycisphaerae bacterium]HOQ84376.1 hypothetical protein [Phycisphaerae bacterium]